MSSIEFLNGITMALVLCQGVQIRTNKNFQNITLYSQWTPSQPIYDFGLFHFIFQVATKERDYRPQKNLQI